MYLPVPLSVSPSLLLSFSPPLLICSNAGVGQSQDDSIVGTKQCRHSVAIMPIMGTLSSSSPDLLQPTNSTLSFAHSSGEVCYFLFTFKLILSKHFCMFIIKSYKLIWDFIPWQRCLMACVHPSFSWAHSREFEQCLGRTLACLFTHLGLDVGLSCYSVFNNKPLPLEYTNFSYLLHIYVIMFISGKPFSHRCGTDATHR